MYNTVIPPHNHISIINIENKFSELVNNTREKNVTYRFQIIRYKKTYAVISNNSAYIGFVKKHVNIN